MSWAPHRRVETVRGPTRCASGASGWPSEAAYGSGDDDDRALGAAGEAARHRAEDAADDAVRGADDDGVGGILAADLLQLVADVAAALHQHPGHVGEVVRAG